MSSASITMSNRHSYKWSLYSCVSCIPRISYVIVRSQVQFPAGSQCDCFLSLTVEYTVLLWLEILCVAWIPRINYVIGRLQVKFPAGSLWLFSLSLSHCWIHYLNVTGDPLWTGLRAWDELTVQPHCLSRYSHYPPDQPPAQLSPDVLSPVRQQISNADIYVD